MTSTSEGELDFTLHTSGSLSVRDPGGSDLAEVDDGEEGVGGARRRNCNSARAVRRSDARYCYERF